MSTDYHCVAIIGCKLSGDKFITREKKSTCKHNPLPTAKYCPECGRPAWQEYDENILTEDSKMAARMKKLGIVAHFYNGDDPCVIGLKKFATEIFDIYESDPPTKKVDIEVGDEEESILEQTKKALKAIGMWDEKTFGMWVVGYIE